MENKDRPAYPLNEESSDRIEYIYSGLTKRELFAAMAMQAICTHEGTRAESIYVASRAVKLADALLIELNK